MGELDAATGPRVETDHDQLEQRVEWIEATLVDLSRHMHNASCVLRVFVDTLQHRDDEPGVLFDQDAVTD